MQNNKLLSISIIILALGMLLSSIYFGYSIQKGSNIQVENAAVNSSVMNISEVANYLGMTEEEVQGIINTEKNMLESRGSYTGIMFPYFIVNDKLYFYKEQIDEWLKDISIQRKEYDTKKLFVF
ncbi:hypothetical protein A500_18017 [Clostridium sartagoforme AAU1]|uniref:Uncharacterized protein n=1 Tax=Clostridium sartagoforme AAU1 TaxID=1202534 RepID=R9BZ24_9CLOT|nr:DNA-binding protein [Clostridium sartagoforme]EOR20226.1 hypothetical protein A500_18017 [Clostridium sartagoforme AAU1]